MSLDEPLARPNEPLMTLDCDHCLAGIFCAGCALHLGQRMHLTTEELAAELGWRPMLGLCTFGEQGTFCTGQAEHGNLMFSIVLFSNVRLSGRATRAPTNTAPAGATPPPMHAFN